MLLLPPRGSKAGELKVPNFNFEGITHVSNFCTNHLEYIQINKNFLICLTLNPCSAKKSEELKAGQKEAEEPSSKNDSPDLKVTGDHTSEEDDHATSSKDDNLEDEEDFSLFDIEPDPNATKLSASINGNNVDEEPPCKEDTKEDETENQHPKVNVVQKVAKEPSSKEDANKIVGNAKGDTNNIVGNDKGIQQTIETS